MRFIKKWYIIVVFALLIGMIGYAVTELFIDEQYSSSASYNVSASVGEKDSDVAKRYVIVGKYDRVLDKMLEDESISKLGMDKSELRSSLVLSANNEVFTAMSVVGDRETARTILMVFDDVAIPEITKIVKEQFSMHDIELIYEAGAGVKISPNTLHNSIISLFVGIIFGVIAIFTPYFAVPTVEGEDELSCVTEKNVIANVPHVDVGNDGVCTRFKKFFKKDGVKTSPIAEGNESYNKAALLMRYKLDILTNEKFMILTGTNFSAGVTSLALSLAKNTANKRTLVIEVGSSSLKESFPSEKRYLEDYLNGNAELDEVVTEIAENVDIIVSSGRVESSTLAKYKELTSLGDEYDNVIIDTLPIVSEPNALAMTALTKNIVLIVPNKERVKRIKRSVALIQDMGLDLVGVVLNNVSKQ